MTSDTRLGDNSAQRPQGAAATDLAIELERINKRFGPVHANKDIDLAVRRGTVHGIVGENGAGKSTLMSILYGFYTADSGEIRVNGVEQAITDSRHALALGIGMVHQHFMLVDNFSILENVILGAEDNALLGPSLERARKELQRLANEYRLDVDPDAIVEDVSVGTQQRVEILKALYRGADILILDEPTGVLTPAEADDLFRVLDELRDQGKTIILITHKLREIMAITDYVSVMRQGADGGDAEDLRDQPRTARRADGRPPRAAARREGPGQSRRDLPARSRTSWSRTTSASPASRT